MAEAHDARELVEAQAAERDADFFPLNDLPNDLIVSVFAVAAAEDPTWVRHTFPLVCKAWNELYLTKDASPLHETLEVNFGKEGKGAAALAAREEAAGRRDPVAWHLRRPFVVHASRVITWAERRAGDVRKLHVKRGFNGAFGDFNSEYLVALVAILGSSLTEISIGPYPICRRHKRPFWESLRDFVVPAGRLRLLAVESIDHDIKESDLEPLQQLAGSLEELVLLGPDSSWSGLSRFPGSFSALTELRRLDLTGNSQITAIPAGISSLKKLKELDLRSCRVSSLPKELGELSRLTKLDLRSNRTLGTTLPAGEAFPAELGNVKSLRELNLHNCNLSTVPAFVGGLKSLKILNLSDCRLTSLPKELGELSGLTRLDLSFNRNLRNTLPADEAFPAELGKMKSLRELKLELCGLRTVPAFVGGLKSLEVLDLSYNRDLQIAAPLDFLIEGCPRLRTITLSKGFDGRNPWPPESRAHLEAFKAKLRGAYLSL